MDRAENMGGGKEGGKEPGMGANGGNKEEGKGGGEEMGAVQEEPKKKKVAPAAIIDVPRKPAPTKDKQGITEELSPAKRELIEPMQQMQYHDPHVLPMNCGGIIMVPIFHITYAAI